MLNQISVNEFMIMVRLMEEWLHEFIDRYEVRCERGGVVTRTRVGIGS